MLVFLIYGSGIIYIQAQYPGYGYKYRPLLGGIQIDRVRVEQNGCAYYKGTASLAFPVKFIEYGFERLGFITAGHAIEVGGGGRDNVYQPTWASNNYIGIGIRTSFPYNGGNSDLDAALIKLENTDYIAFIYENGNLYFGYDGKDNNNKVGITDYVTPLKNMERQTIVYKSGRTTGLTYGRIEKIDLTWYLANGGQIYPTILITKCPGGQCYYSGNISAGGDSGGVWYIRHVIHIRQLPENYLTLLNIKSLVFTNYIVREYGAKVIGIHNAGDGTNAIASWAVKVKEKWPDISFVTCGPDYSPSCR